MKLKKCIIVALLFFFNTLTAQVDSAKGGRIYINSSLILNKAYSQFEKLTGNFGRSGYYEKIKPIGNQGLFKPGFYLSINAMTGKNPKRKFVFGAALSITQNQYKHITHDPGNSNVLGLYVGEFTDVDIDIHETMYIMSAEIGTRRRLFKRFYFGNFLVLHINLINIRSETGNATTTNYVGYPYGNPYAYLNNSQSEVSPINTRTTNSALLDKEAGAGVSYRPSLSYRCFINKHSFEITAFRNFSLRKRYSRPWWGLGLSYFLK